MSSSTPRTKDFMKLEDSNLDVGFSTKKNKTNLDTSDFEKVNNLVEDQKNGLRFTNDMSIFLFKKYLTRSQQKQREKERKSIHRFRFLGNMPTSTAAIGDK
jgi:hypothetical protein